MAETTNALLANEPNPFFDVCFAPPFWLMGLLLMGEDDMRRIFWSRCLCNGSWLMNEVLDSDRDDVKNGDVDLAEDLVQLTVNAR